MAIGQDILDALAPLTAALATLTTSVDTLIANIEAAVLAGTIPADVAQAILGTIVADKAAADDARAKLDAEVAKLNPPPAPTPLA